MSLQQIKQLRAKTKSGVMDCRQALEACGGDLKKAEAWLLKKGAAEAAKRQGRATKSGSLATYLHHDKQMASMVSMACETDFVARTDDFQNVVQEVAMQVGATDPKTLQALLKQPWIRNQAKTIGDLVKELSAKTGEKIEIKGFKRMSLED